MIIRSSGKLIGVSYSDYDRWDIAARVDGKYVHTYSNPQPADSNTIGPKLYNLMSTLGPFKPIDNTPKKLFRADVYVEYIDESIMYIELANWEGR